MLFSALLNRLVTIGSISVTDAAGKVTRHEGRLPGPHVAIRYADKAGLRLMRAPSTI